MSDNKYGSSPRVEPAAIDHEHLQRIRQNVVEFMQHAAGRYASDKPARLLDVAPENHEGARPFFPSTVVVETLDIDPKSGATFVADLCKCNQDLIPDESFDFIVCTEVLEHTLRPFDAVCELRRILKPQGYLFVSVPFNFRIHGPLPDCWRFTEHGLRALLSPFSLCELNSLETPERPLMPIHYTVVAQKPMG